MEYSDKKIWAHYEEIKFILGLYIVLFFVVPFCIFGFCYLAHSAEIDDGVQGAINSMLLIGAKWCAVIMPILTVLFIVWFFFYSDKVKCTDTNIEYYRFLFSKESRNVPYSSITKCVFKGELWHYKNKYVFGRKILIFNKSDVILQLDLYYKLCLLLIDALGERKAMLVGNNETCKTVDNYFKLDFDKLPDSDKLKILKYYCKSTRTKYKAGEEILNKK